MTRLTIRRGGTKRVRATFFADQSAGLARDLSGLTLMVIDQSPNIAPPSLSILSPPSLPEGGDVLTYSSPTNTWINEKATRLVDGGNF